MVLCDLCNECFHEGCAASEVARGPWYCPHCQRQVIAMGSVDPILDLQLLDYLFKNRLPKRADHAARVRRLATTCRAH